MFASQNLEAEVEQWKPIPTQIPEGWREFAEGHLEQMYGSSRTPVMQSTIDAQRVGDLLRSWGLPWQVVMAGYLWDCNEKQIALANRRDVYQVLSHITQAKHYISSIESENLPILLSPPYYDLGARLIAVAIYFQALQILQGQSNGRPYTGMKRSHIESVGRTLINLSSRLGMWYFKRDLENLKEQILSPARFTEDKQQHLTILKQDADMLEDVRQLLINSYHHFSRQRISITYSFYSIPGIRRRLEADAALRSQKAKLSVFDLMTFDVMASTVQESYTVLGALSQLGYIQDRVTDLIANPKVNGCSHIAFGLILKAQDLYTRALKWPESYTRICQLLIATPVMHAINWYGCLYPRCYQLHIEQAKNEEVNPPNGLQFWNSEEGKVFFTVKKNLNLGQPRAKSPIIVYNNKHERIDLPQGATALDFAYVFSTELAEHAVDALINNRKAPLYSTLDPGDIVEIRIVSEIQVQERWLHENYANTSLARRTIKDALTRYSLEHRGYALLNQILNNYHFMLLPEDLDQEMRLLVNQHNLGSLDTYLARLDEKAQPPYTPDWAANQIIQRAKERADISTMPRGRSSWIPVLDIQLAENKKKVHQQRFCGFCQPTYPVDMKIIGRLRKQSGMLIVHRANCPHLIDRNKSYPSILLPMVWQLRPPAFRVAFFITAQDRKGLILDVTRQLRRYECDLVSLSATAISASGEGHLKLTIEAHADKEVLDVWQDLYHIENVISVEIDAAGTSSETRERLQDLREQHISLPSMVSEEPHWNESLALLPPRNLILRNPFDISRPATDSMFFGRTEEIRMMRRELSDGEYGRALILFGPRRSGKSSICKNFLEQYVKSPFWNVLFSLQNATHQNEETILEQLADEVCRKFEEQIQLPPASWHDFTSNDPQLRFKQVVQRCITNQPGSRLVLALDEFGGAIDAYKRHILEARFFTFWKDLIQQIPQVSLIFAMPTDAHNALTSKRFANAFSFAQTLPVLFLDTESAKHLIVDPLQEQHVAIQPRTVALAVTITGGNPYFLTLIGQQLILQLNRDPNKQIITDKDLRLVIENFIQGGSNQNFVYLKRELQNEYELHILEAIVELTMQMNQLEVQLKQIANRLNLSRYLVKRHLDRLCNGLILQENGPAINPYYSFTIELVRRWLAQNRWFFSSLQ